MKESYTTIDDFCQKSFSYLKKHFLTSLYGTSLNCIHQILLLIVETNEELNLKEKEIKEIVLKILISDKDIRNKKEEKGFLIKEIIKDNDIQPPKHTVLVKLIDQVIECFHSVPQQQLLFNIDYEFQKLYIEKAQKQNDFPKVKKQSPTITNATIKKDDEEFWFNFFEPEIVKKAMKLKYETLSEITTVYPESIYNNLAKKICDINYRKSFSNREESEL